LGDIPADKRELRRKFRGITKPGDEVFVRAGNLVVLHEKGAVPSGPQVLGF
jgi:hypothetical protein